MINRNYGRYMDEQYKSLLENLDHVGTLLSEANLASYELHQISFNYLSYDFKTNFHAVIYENELALKLRFSTVIFNERTAFFEIVLDRYGCLTPLEIKGVERTYLNILGPYNISTYFHKLLSSFLEQSDFYHLNLEVSNA